MKLLLAATAVVISKKMIIFVIAILISMYCVLFVFSMKHHHESQIYTTIINNANLANFGESAHKSGIGPSSKCQKFSLEFCATLRINRDLLSTSREKDLLLRILVNPCGFIINNFQDYKDVPYGRRKEVIKNHEFWMKLGCGDNRPLRSEIYVFDESDEVVIEVHDGLIWQK